MMNTFTTEKDGQIAFFERFNIPVDEDNSILVDNTDGIYNGNLFEFKLSINNLNNVLQQAIKYLSALRIRGKNVPARILLVDLNATLAYVFNAVEFKDAIQGYYSGPASTNNDNFAQSVQPAAVYDYSRLNDLIQLAALIENKDDPWYLPIDIDETCVSGWAERYYRENPKASKASFLSDTTDSELRNPKHFKGLINPYTGSNESFRRLMDCLNDRMNKKALGAFYTPQEYCEKAVELVMKAINRVPAGNDYVIIDRCAGTGNLEEALIGVVDDRGDDVISHCILSTVEFFEYKLLKENFQDKARHILFADTSAYTDDRAKLPELDATSKEFIENPVIKQYVDNPNCTIILLENPPFSDQTAGVVNATRGRKEQTYLVSEMKKEVKGTATNDLLNQFVWSAFKFYLRQETDSYIVFGPIKYWKNYNFVDRQPVKGFAFNKGHFGTASPSVVTCILWANKPSEVEEFELTAYNIK